jgi:hypothetical protein
MYDVTDGEIVAGSKLASAPLGPFPNFGAPTDLTSVNLLHRNRQDETVLPEDEAVLPRSEVTRKRSDGLMCMDR